jgi:hypothetical protein
MIVIHFFCTHNRDFLASLKGGREEGEREKEGTGGGAEKRLSCMFFSSLNCTTGSMQANLVSDHITIVLNFQPQIFTIMSEEDFSYLVRGREGGREGGRDCMHGLTL